MRTDAVIRFDPTDENDAKQMNISGYRTVCEDQGNEREKKRKKEKREGKKKVDSSSPVLVNAARTKIPRQSQVAHSSKDKPAKMSKLLFLVH
jgi:hypothetical protein